VALRFVALRFLVLPLLGWLLLSGGVQGAAAAEPVAYTLVPEQSQVVAVLRREGALSVLAHDHVLVARHLDATLQVALTDLERSTAELSLKVADLMVDASADRRAAGLADSLEDDSRAEIRDTMLSDAGLDAARFPEIRMRLLRARGAPSEADLTVVLRIHGVEKEYSVFATVLPLGERIRIRGTFELLQSDHGIRPYTALLGAIAVEDRVTVTFDLVAERSR
jgi:polyisoprenoid-binding protein YceI